MVRNKRYWTEEKLDRYTNEGRGQGSGRNYNPWIDVSDFFMLNLITALSAYTHQPKQPRLKLDEPARDFSIVYI